MEWFKQHKVLSIIGGVLLFFIIIGVATSDTSTTDSNTNSETAQEETESNAEQATASAGIGDPVRDGKFEFTVASFECGQTTLGTNEFLQADAQGEFCVMSLTVENIGDEPQSFFSSEQLVFNAEGQKYSNSTDAEIALDDNDVWLSDINPGNKITGKLVFDVPKGSSIVKAELHDSSFSNGVEVNLQ